MSRTHRKKPDIPFAGFRERVRTRSEMVGRQRCRDEAAEEGFALSEHYRVPPTKWDDIPCKAAREGRWWK